MAAYADADLLFAVSFSAAAYAASAMSADAAALRQRSAVDGAPPRYAVTPALPRRAERGYGVDGRQAR